MKFKSPEFAKLAKLKNKVVRRQRALQKKLSKKLHFVVEWKEAAKKQVIRLGHAIERVSPPWLKKVGRIIWWPFGRLVRRIRRFLKRRPHRSFRLTRRRDYKRSLKMPGYWSFTNTVRAMLWGHKKLFGGLVLVYFVVALAIGGFGQQETYQGLSDTLNETGADVFTGNFGKVGEAGLLLTTSIVTGLTPNVTGAQSVLGSLAAFFVWLATVWALRGVMAGRNVKVRDAVYSSGAPVLSTVIVGFVFVVQMLPVSIATLIYNTAIRSELISGGVEQMLAWVVIILLGILALYWMTSTVVAMVVVTLPGMYPFQAIRTAGDLVVGRRIRILLRFLWMVLLVIIAWLLIVIPIIMGDAWLKKLWPAVEWLPIVPISLLVMSSLTIVFAATYVYMLYRKVVDDDANPA